MLEKEGTSDVSEKRGKDGWCSKLVGRHFLLILCCLYHQRLEKKPGLGLCKYIGKFPIKEWNEGCTVVSQSKTQCII